MRKLSVARLTAAGLAIAMVGCTAGNGSSIRPGSTGNSSREPARDGWVPLFNGKDLTGWAAEGKAEWKVDDGVLVGTQGPGNAPGDLFTTAAYADFELEATYRVQWPANTGIWFRYQSEQKAYQADILEWPDPLAYSGTIYCPGRMFLAVNSDPKLEKKEDWNTMRIRAEGDRLRVWLNGVQTADVRDGSIDRGRIGIQVHPGDQFAGMKVMIREMKIRVLNAPGGG